MKTLLIITICSFAGSLLGETPQIRISIGAQSDNGDDARMVSALSHEFRKLDNVLVTDTQPTLKITCVAVDLTRPGAKTRFGYAASIAITDSDDRLITHLVQTHATIEALAHEIAVKIDGSEIEQMRRDAQPSR
jgi:hypothetical protein